MAKGVCCVCGTELNKENAGERVLKQDRGRCRPCHAKYIRDWVKNNPEKAKAARLRNYKKHIIGRRATKRKYYSNNSQFIKDWQKQNNRTPKGRHIRVTRLLRVEKVPSTDPLWSFNYYFEIIRDNKCHYCGGMLAPTGHALDRMINDNSHTSYNVVPCCWDCNTVKANRFSYEEMMLLSPALKKIYEIHGTKELPDL